MAKRKAVSDAQLVEACLECGKLKSVKVADKDWPAISRALNALDALCLRAANEREAKK